jgi:dehydro coenzyme F420 reductase / coenzyme F420-0:L-glutamate ligase / coenzyme F420-1:gamma-L-glutamate ligase
LTVQVLPIGGLPEIRAGDDLAGMLSEAAIDLRSGDVLAVTQKIVSKAEGRVVPEENGRDAWVARETTRVVARRGDVVIAETRHGFVCANAGVDASNVEPGSLALLPDDPDGSAESIRRRLAEDRGIDVGVVVTDTFGRPWRRGVVNVAIGCAGLPALVDLRGTKDHHGRVLEATIVALADEVAAASGLVMGKDAMIPAAIVRGLTPAGPPTGARELVRPPEEDMFRESPLQSIHARRSIGEFGDGIVPREAIEEAVRAACASVAPPTRPWLFVALESEAAKHRLIAALATPDLRGTVLIVPAADARGAERRAGAEREAFLLSAGAVVQSLMLALHAQGLASCWDSSALFHREESCAALDLDDSWEPMGTVACGWPPAHTPPPPPELEISDVLRFA